MSAAATPATRAGSTSKSFQPQRLFNKRRSVALIALTSLLVLTSLALFINTQIQAAGQYVSPVDATATAGFATVTAGAATVTAISSQEKYPANFPGHGTLEDDYPLMGKSTTPSTASACSLQIDGYHILVPKQKTIDVCLSHELEYSGVAMRVRLTMRSGDCGGIVLRFDASSGAGYFFYLCQNHTYGLLSNFSGKRRVNLISPTALPTSLPATNTLALVALNQTLTLLYFLFDRVVKMRKMFFLLFKIASYEKQKKRY